MHAFIRTLVILSTLVLSLGVAGGAASAAPMSDVAGQVYVNNNTAGVNTISGFNRRLDGTLTPLPGSPFIAGGA